MAVFFFKFGKFNARLINYGVATILTYIFISGLYIKFEINMFYQVVPFVASIWKFLHPTFKIFPPF